MTRALLFTLILILARDCFALDLDAILERNSRAHGGADNFARISNVRYLLTISEPGFEVAGTYLATRNGNMRIDIEADGQRVFSEGLDDGQAWQWTPGGGIEMQDSAAAAALRHGIDLPGRFFTIEQARERGAYVSLVGPVTDGKASQWQVRVVLPDGFSRDYYIDRETGRIVRERDFRAFHPAIDATRETVETRYRDPQWVDGVLRYAQSENRNADSDEWLGTTLVRSVEHNVDVNDGDFEPQ